MATAEETLRATLSDTEYNALTVLAGSADELSGRKVATALNVSPTTANDALGTLAEAGFVTSRKSGRATLWRLAVTNPSISTWLEETMPIGASPSTGSSPYSTGGGGVRLEHTYAACLVASLLAGDAIPELGDAISADSIRLQASDRSDVDDILLEGRDAHGEVHRSSIAVRRSPLLTKSDSASVPLFQDFLSVVIHHWTTVEAGHWRLVLAVSTNANAITQLAELAELASSLPNAAELEDRLAQPGRTNANVRNRYEHLTSLVEQAAEDLTSTEGIETAELVWRLLSCLTVRELRLERTDRVDRSAAVNTLQRILRDGTPAAADALFSRIEELVGTWAPQAAVLNQTVIRRSLSNYPLATSPRFASAWSVIDRLGLRLRESVRPALGAGSCTLELERSAERARVKAAMKLVGDSAGSLVVTGDPDVGKSALCLRVAEGLHGLDATVTTLSLRDLPQSTAEFETLLAGPSIDEVLAAGATAPLRLILVDGAESVLEGKAAVLQTLATAAMKAGLGVVAVTRTDGSRHVQDVLSRSCELAGIGTPPTELVLGPLAQGERAQVAATFPALTRLGGDGRASWLLGRPGLLDVLLRTGQELDPAEFLCEADVFGAVWLSLIRGNEERRTGTASPDDRERVMLSVAKRVLGLVGDHVAGTAAGELRSDGVLRLPNNPALSSGDEFSTDLFRDFALCRLFIVEGWQTLESANAPRWSIRAARLACQAALVAHGAATAWNKLTAHFTPIAEAHGARWSEVPFEALLTLGGADQAIRELWDSLTDGDATALATLLRLAEARFVSGTFGDVFALAPLVKVAFCERPTIPSGQRFGHRALREVINDLVLAWLRGMATSQLQPNSLRQSVRDTILLDDRPYYDEFAVEALATLGPDLNERAETWLRDVARERPGSLNATVESLAVSASMSVARPEVLLDLAEAYYIELPDPRDRWGGHTLDDGIRDFKHGVGPGFGVPAAAWYYGPFFRLLNSRPIETIAFINRMLDHAARFRVDKMSTYRHGSDAPEDLEGVRLDLPGIGERLFVGDSHVWAWYRGTSVGPYACMSALLALERFADDMLERVKVPAQRLVELLLADCHNLAVPGLVVGILTRHPEATGDLLDPFLASPSVWHLESARVTGDYGFRVRDPDADKLTGSDRRQYMFHETVAGMVINARLAGNEERLAQLGSLGEKLVAAARTNLEGPEGNYAEYLATIDSWAAEFCIENYRASRNGEQVLIQFERPEPIERVLAPRDEDFQKTNALYGLQNTYGRFNDEPTKWPLDTLAEDLATARRIEEGQHVPEGMLWPENALVAVAAAAIRSHALDLATIVEPDLRWAIEALLWAAENPRVDEMSYYETTFPMGADRAAAAALPLLLLDPFDNLGLDTARVGNALAALATSLFDEVRAIYVKGCEPLWERSCDVDHATGVCRRHSPAWSAVTRGLRDCRLGEWSQETQRREPDPLPPPFDVTLPSVSADAMMVNRLRMPLSVMVDARRVPCLQEAVSGLWTPLWDSYRRGTAHWWEEGYDHHAQAKHEPIAQRMVQVALDDDPEVVETFVRTLAANSNALHLLFDGFATVFTYADDLRSAMPDFWPRALETALDAVGDGSALRSEHHWFDYMVAALLPTPSPHSWDPDIDGTFTRARQNWIRPEALGDLAPRWLQLAKHESKAVDAVIKFGRSATRAWQTTVALEWIEVIVDHRYDLIANRLYYLEEWFTELRSANVIHGEVRTRYHRIIDGLAAAGDRAAVRLQQLDE
ncbi:helix-turn-helix domain-containing protein [Isoptericola croceus]|uniref:helix-turn-helix domain-containing protein n=1 Tax=Isoptericola croceus TaxID=3031406 RepID=UPI0023F6E0CD|nr:helix-turn-helix domain-containing protein [Isoptericola croceus]